MSHPVLTDARGTPIEVGSRVAYNLSGDVALGTVIRLTYGYTDPIFIRPDDTWVNGYRRSPYSRVKSRHSVLVLQPDEDPNV